MAWCRQHHVNMHQPTVAEVCRFLRYLFSDQNLGFRTVQAYKSIIVTLIHPDQQQLCQQSDALRRLLLGMAASRPPVKPAPVWFKEDVIQYLQRHGPTRNSQYEVGRHLALLILLFGGRRVSDLTLLHIGDSDMKLSEKKLVLQPRFGSKTDGKGDATFVQSAQKFYSNKCWSVNIPAITRRYLKLTAPFRKGETALFVSTRDGHTPASTVVIGGWIRSLLQLAGVTASAGSVRSAVATSACLSGCKLKDVLRNGNWRSASTLTRHYLRPPTQ
jgi:hypothetical protein